VVVVVWLFGFVLWVCAGAALENMEEEEEL
jgi:hypothetical protein